MSLISTTVDLGTEFVIPDGLGPCSEAMQRAVIASAVKNGVILTVGQRILYVELKLLPYPHWENCIVIVGGEIPTQRQ